jgi:hypothetical protein
VLSLPVRKIAARVVISLGIKWETQRLLWIAVSKAQEANCHMAKLPVELIRTIMMWTVLLGGLHDYDETISTGNLIREVATPYL